ncbi:hypothetical protein VC77_08135, partial [Vibrio cholerae]
SIISTASANYHNAVLDLCRGREDPASMLRTECALNEREPVANPHHCQANRAPTPPRVFAQ